MGEWLPWLINILCVTALGVIGFFVKRTFVQHDKAMEESALSREKTEKRLAESYREIIERLDRQREEWLSQLEKIKYELKESAGKNQEDIEKLETRVNEIIKEMPRLYVQKEDWLLSNQNIDRKLDKIMEILINQGKGRYPNE